MRTKVQNTSVESYHATDRSTFKTRILAYMVQQSEANQAVSIGDIARHFKAEKSTVSGLFNSIKKDATHEVDGVRYNVLYWGTAKDPDTQKTVQVFMLERIAKVSQPPVVIAALPQPIGQQLTIF